MREPNPALIPALQLAVPLWITELERKQQLVNQWLGRETADVIATHGDDLMYGGKHTAAAFNALAKGIALLAYAPGGITVLGHHWCVAHRHQGVPTDGRPLLCEEAGDAD